MAIAAEKRASIEKLQGCARTEIHKPRPLLALPMLTIWQARVTLHKITSWAVKLLVPVARSRVRGRIPPAESQDGFDFPNDVSRNDVPPNGRPNAELRARESDTGNLTTR